MGRAVRVRNTIVNGGMTGRDTSINKVFAHKEGSSFSTMKRFNPASNPQSVLQSVIRDTFAQTSAGWSNLTEAERQQWNAEAPSWVNTGIFGEKKQSGKNLYTGCNIALAYAGLPLINVPSAKEMQALVDTLSFSRVNGQLVLDVSFSTVSPDNAIQLFVSDQVTAGTSKVDKLVKLYATDTQQDINLALTTAYTVKYGSLITGRKIFYAIKQVSQGGNVVSLASGFIVL